MAGARLPYAGQAHPESIQYVRSYTAVQGVPPRHNVMVRTLVARGLSRTRARHDWQVLVQHHQPEQEEAMMDVQGYPREEVIAPGASVSVEGDAEVPALRAEVEALKRDLAGLCSRERTREDAVQQVRAVVEVLQPLLALVEEGRDLVRRYPSVGRTIMRAVRTHSGEDYALLFWLADRCGLPLAPNDAGQRQQHFMQGQLVPGRR